MASPSAAGAVPGPREARRRQRIEVGREQILDTAEELFGALGYRGTSLQQVAARCEFSVGALYLFFTNKEELFREVLTRRGRRQQELVQAVADREGPPLEALLDLVDTIIGFHREHPGFGQISTRMLAPGGGEGFPRSMGDFAERRDQALAPVVAIIERGQREGAVRAGEPLVLARLLSALVTAHHTMDPALLGTTVAIDDGAFRAFVRDAFTARR